MKTCRILSTGSYAPNFEVSNFDLEKFIDTNNEWIVTRTGIENRRISINETTLDIAYKAAQNAINRANIPAESIELIIVATITPDNFTPSTASLIQAKLGLNDCDVISFDINAACTGLIYAIQIASKYISSGCIKRALVIGAETLSKITNWQDRSTCVLFGDGAGAIILEDDDKGLIADYTNSKGDDKYNLLAPAVPLRNAFIENEKDKPSYIYMNGSEIFKFATFAIKDSIEKMLEKSNLDINDIKYIVPHQANKRIIAKVSRILNIPLDRFWINLQNYGNTSSASIGIALDELVDSGKLERGDKIILVGFGGGLTWGATLFEY